VMQIVQTKTKKLKTQLAEAKREQSADPTQGQNAMPSTKHTDAAPRKTSTPPSSASSSATGSCPTSSPANAAARSAEPPEEGQLSGLLRRAAQNADNSPHVIVEARAGTGKTTTLIGALQVLKGGLPTSASGQPLTPSPQQQAVWDAVAMSRGKAHSVCFVAFNRSIASELKTRVPPGVEAMTMHAMGLRAVTSAMSDLRAFSLDQAKWVIPDRIAKVMGGEARELRKTKIVLMNAAEQLVSLAKQNMVTTWDRPQPEVWQDLDALASHYEVEVGNRSETYPLVCAVMDLCRNPLADRRFNYDDMIWLPVVLGLPLQRYDLLMVDEAQDLNRCQQELAKRAGKRLILCGDPKQAIYGFAGADAESMNHMYSELTCNDDGRSRGCVVLPLTVTRRCGKAIVGEARRIVPDFEAHESNGAGAVSELTMESVDCAHCHGTGHEPYNDPDKGMVHGENELCSNCDVCLGYKTTGYANQVLDGDMVLCRVNAPLVSQCFRFLKAGRKANIQGRNIGQGLVSAVERLCKPLDPSLVSAPTLISKMHDWHATELAKEHAKKMPSEAAIINLQDKLDCLSYFTMEAENARDVIRKIEAVFTDDKSSPGIRLSSIHKAKGLEAKRVFFLMPKGGECPHPMAKSAWQQEQEMNLKYVAITRAIEKLTYVY